MVIHQFNKLIRNKWLWGAFAVAISAFFAFDFLLDDLRGSGEPQDARDFGTLAGEQIDGKLFQVIADEVRGIGRNRDWKMNQGDANRSAWENYAALKVADANGIEATDAEVAAAIRRDPSFQANGAFSFALYQGLLRENQMSPEQFEASLKRRMTLMRLGQAVLGSAAWASPMELDQAVADMTDTFTVKVARFSQEKKDADAVKVGEPEIKKWYDENAKSLALPERVRIRYVWFNALDKKVLDKMVVTDDELKDHYDTTIDRYTSTDTNGVEQVKKFDEVKDKVEREVREIAAVEYFKTNITQRAYAIKAAKGASRLDEIAKEDGLTVETSDWFSTDGGYQEGFMKYASSICPGAEGFNEAVAELDLESEDLRYAVVSGKRGVWLIEKKDVSPKHTPTFDEAKAIIMPRVLKAAKADAFKASIEKIIKGGTNAVLAAQNVSTNLTFSIADMKGTTFPDQMTIARAASKLQKGEISELALTGTGRGVVVVCVDRTPGDAAKAMVLRSQVQNDIAMLQMRQVPESWRSWNLARMGFETTENTSVEKVETDEE